MVVVGSVFADVLIGAVPLAIGARRVLVEALVSRVFEPGRLATTHRVALQ